MISDQAQRGNGRSHPHSHPEQGVQSQNGEETHLLHCPPAFVGPVPKGVFVNSCMLSAIAFAGVRTKLYEHHHLFTDWRELPQRMYDLHYSQNARVVDYEPHIISPEQRQHLSTGDLENKTIEQLHAANGTLMVFFTIFCRIYRGRWAHELVLPCSTVHMSMETAVGLTNVVAPNGDIVSADMPFETPFAPVDENGHVPERATADVPLVVSQPRSALEAANIFRELFCRGSKSLLHGKGLGIHELGEMPPVDLRATIVLFNEIGPSENMKPLGPCDLCAIISILEERTKGVVSHLWTRAAPRLFYNQLRPTFARVPLQQDSFINGEPTHVLVRRPKLRVHYQ